MPKRKSPKPADDPARIEAAFGEIDHRKAHARRTAWIIAAIAAAFFIASLVQGHFLGIPNWVPRP